MKKSLPKNNLYIISSYLQIEHIVVMIQIIQ